MITTPIIRFDENKKEHRKDFFRLLETNCLGKCKNRYTLEGNYGSITGLMMEKIARYYINKEFNKKG